MKSLIQFLVGIAVAATCFVGCSNSYEDIESAIGSNFTLTLVTDGLSRTEYDPDLCDIKWSEGDLAQVLVKGTMPMQRPL